MGKTLNQADIDGIRSLRKQFLEADLRLGEAILQMQHGPNRDEGELAEFLREECLLAVLGQKEIYNRYMDKVFSSVGTRRRSNLYRAEPGKEGRHEDLNSR